MFLLVINYPDHCRLGLSGGKKQLVFLCPGGNDQQGCIRRYSSQVVGHHFNLEKRITQVNGNIGGDWPCRKHLVLNDYLLIYKHRNRVAVNSGIVIKIQSYSSRVYRHFRNLLKSRFFDP